MTDDSVEEVLEQLGRGEIEALGELVSAYAPYLRAVVRTRLSDRLRQHLDSVDVVQSVWVQVIRQLGRDGWHVNDAAHLRALLVTIARRRLASRARQHTRDEPVTADWADAPDRRQEPPSEAAQGGDLWEKMLRLTPPEHHPILHLRRQGLQLAEIAARTGLHEGSVRRILRRLSRELALGEEPVPAGADTEGGV
ncbi:MAG TPA: sigma-70 family RNA polymerase sigma factor [Urbifossiella sp.]|jgi:RNA polymerase sigma-70 factor (ECF subfamily)|nr:sigma-70 family RNA polymerase sigma factor [Urbifossiella sp.]